MIHSKNADRAQALGIVFATIIALAIIWSFAFKKYDARIHAAKDQVRINGVVDQQKELEEK